MRGAFKIAAVTLAVLVIGVGSLFFIRDWDWFVPFASRQASAALGRPVTIRHLRISLARNPIVEADGLTVGNPSGFPADAPPLAILERLGFTLDGMAWLRHRSVGLLEINVIHPVIEARALPDGTNNWSLGSGSAAQQSPVQQSSGGTRPTVGVVHIEEGRLHVVDPHRKSDFVVNVATRDAPGDAPPAERQQQGRIVATAQGTYAQQPVAAEFQGGALLAARSKTNPYPIDLSLRNGPTRVEIKGTVLDPTAFGGADLRLAVAGPNLGLLTSLVGFAVPETKPYRLAGKLDYADRRIRFTNIDGRIGNTDVTGEILADPGAGRPQVTAELVSDRVDMADLEGFLAGNPNAPPSPPNAPLLPHATFNMPRLQFADVDLKYRARRIEGRFQPLDNLAADLGIKDGAISLHPLSFGVGSGRIVGNITLTPRGATMLARGDIDFHQVDVNRLMAATHTFKGAGVIGGRAEIEGTGNSVAGILGNGRGAVKLFMTGGDISAVLVNLSGLDFANSLLSALGVPQRAPVRCMVVDLPLSNGALDIRTLLLDTTEANVTGHGSINLRDESLDVHLNTEGKHLSIGSLHGPIDIGGRLRSPTIRPAAESAARAGAAVGLGAVLTPLAALLPTISLGLGEDNDCNAVIRTAQQRSSR